MSLEALLATREVVVFCGPGGVGKTSVAAAAALGAAARLGGRVLVLTVDPARRLADALGVSDIGNVERRIAPERLRAAGIDARGELHAAMLDTKSAWDDLVLRHTPNEEAAYRILENPLYRSVTGRFVQSHDYIAMERLYEIHASGKYDLIVVDTPPTRNAVDFLDAPARMREFFGGRLVRWLTMPYRIGGRRGARLVNFASRPFYQLADRILGSQFLHEIADFFLNFETMYDGFVQRAEAVERLMHDRRTAFVVVTSLEGGPLREAQRFREMLVGRGLYVGGLVCNRAMPPELLSHDAARAAEQLCRDHERVAKDLVAQAVVTPADRAALSRVLRTIGESFLDFSVVAARESTLRAELRGPPDAVVVVPSFEDDVHDLRGLARIQAHLLSQEV